RVLEHFAGNGCARDSRRAELRRIAAHDEDLAELDDLAGLAVDPVDPDDVFGGNPVLFAAGLDDCEHLSSSCSIPVLGPVPDRLLSVGLLFVFKGLSSPRKSTRTQRPARDMLMAGNSGSCQESALPSRTALIRRSDRVAIA